MLYIDDVDCRNQIEEKRRTKFKTCPDDQYSKLYPCLDDAKDYLECTNADYAPYRFDYNNLDKATEYLVENGYVVIKNVLNSKDLKKGKSLLWDLLKSKSIGWDPNDYLTWDLNKIGGELQNGLVWGKGIGQSKFQWFGRKHPKVLNIFSHLWSHKLFPLNNNVSLNGLDENKENDDYKPIIKVDGNKDLLTSFDGIGLFTPWYLTNELDRTNSGWYHIDVNVKRKPGIQTIQGYLTYYDQNESTGSTVLIPKTHLQVKNVLKLTKYQGDFIRIRPSCQLLDSSKYKKILLCTKAGDMVLWDSRTIHCNSPSLLTQHEMKEIYIKKKNENNNNNNDNDGDDEKINLLNKIINVFNKDKEENQNDKIEFLRLVSMICMVPKSRVKNKNVLKDRIKAFNEKMTLSHWPNEFSMLWRPHKCGKNNIKTADQLTKSLVGYQ